MKKRIQRRLPFGPCLPARVDPQPLVGMRPADPPSTFVKAPRILMAAPRFTVENRVLPRKAAHPIPQGVSDRIVERPRHIVQRKSIQRVRKRGNLPRPDVTGQEDPPTAAVPCFEKVLVCIQNPKIFYILFPPSMELCEFCRHPPEVASHFSDDGASLRIAPCRK